jgi:hypothetical protein
VRQITIRLEDDLAVAAKREALRRGISQSALVREALVAFLSLGMTDETRARE